MRPIFDPLPSGSSAGRDNKIKQWAELGEFQSIGDAARGVLELERRPLGALFFRVYVDPPGAKSDAEILCRLEYQSENSFYLLQRASCSDFPEDPLPDSPLTTTCGTSKPGPTAHPHHRQAS
jgi:hypothetical protein